MVVVAEMPTLPLLAGFFRFYIMIPLFRPGCTFFAFLDLCHHAFVITVYYALTAAPTSDRIAITNAPSGLKMNAPTYYK